MNDELVRILEGWQHTYLCAASTRGNPLTVGPCNCGLDRALTLARQGAEDTRRLDWLETILQLIGSDGLARKVWDTQHAWDRAAIDAAMKEGEGKP